MLTRRSEKMSVTLFAERSNTKHSRLQFDGHCLELIYVYRLGKYVHYISIFLFFVVFEVFEHGYMISWLFGFMAYQPLWLFNAKSIFIQIISSISNNSV